MNDPRWRSKAKEVLYLYPHHLQQLREYRNDLLYSLPATNWEKEPGSNRPGDPTGNRALRLANGISENIICQVRAVQRLQALLNTSRRLDQRKLRMLELVYFRRTSSLLGYAVSIGTSDRTVSRWNHQMLSFIAYQMGWQEQCPTFTPGRPKKYME